MLACPSCLRSVPEGGISCPACGASLVNSWSPTRHQVKVPRDKQAQVGGLPHAITAATPLSNGRFITGATVAERYRIISLVGSGGMGEVYKAEDLKLDQTVALKFLPESFAFDGAALTRFRNEVRITRQISHPNVCRVYDIGEVDGRTFLSMEFIDGEDLSSLLRRIGRLPGDKATEIARQICAGLAAAHDNGVLHRDLKPANIMIDGRGKARVTDFGVAVAAQEVRSDGVIAGTPTYMAPEQLTGKEVTQQSDIYALGLVLYELFTGKRVFEANSVHDMLKLHDQSTPTTPSSHVKNIEPLVEKIILRCLEKDPKKRPASAIQVAAALPGGDPLQAALALGETPSPEMVAASPEQGTLRPIVATLYFVALLAGLAFIVLLSGKVKLHRQVPLDKSPDVIRERANEIVHRLGYGDPPTDSTMGMGYDRNYIRYASEHHNLTDLTDGLKTGRLPVFQFQYRQSPRYLVPYSGWQVTGTDPPREISDMAGVTLDTQGRLINFYAVPPQVEEPQAATPPPDWSILFAEAGLDISKFTPATPRQVPAHHNDARAAWEGILPGAPQIPIRVEAAGYRSRATYFEIIFPWDAPSLREQNRKGSRIVGIAIPALVLTVIVAGVMLARRNYRRELGDRKGASRLALFMLVLSIFHWVLAAHHVPEMFFELSNLFTGIEMGLFIMSLLWIFYMVLEPVVRRRWPTRIISWSRLLAGDFRDPLVGRDVLIGAVLGTALTLTGNLSILAPRLFGRPLDYGGIASDTLLGFNEIVHFIFGDALTGSLAVGLGSVFLLSLMLIILRRAWLTGGVAWVLLTAFFVVNGRSGFDLLFPAVSAGIVIFALMRIGLLAAISMLFFSLVTNATPMTSNVSAYYASSTAMTLVTLTILAVYGYRTALAGQRLFSGRLIED